MKPQNKSLISFIGNLKKITPPNAIIHIGTGQGMSDMHCWQEWDVPFALMINADSYQWSEDLAEKQDNWHTYSAVLSNEEKECTFYTFSNPRESGLIKSKILKALYPSIKTLKTRKEKTQRLDNFLQKNTLKEFNHSSSIWMIIDCLDNMSILEGAGKKLEIFDVLWLRVLLKEQDNLELVGLEHIKNYLKSYQYRYIESIESNHSSIVYVFFVKDTQKQINLLKENIDYLKKENYKNIKKYKEILSKLDLERQLFKEKNKQLKIDIEYKNKKNHKKQFDDLSNQLQEKIYQQQLIDQNFIKTKAQIELIKDILLKGVYDESI